MKRLINTYILILICMVFSCEEWVDELAMYGGSDLLEQLNDAWEDFGEGTIASYDSALTKFQQARAVAESMDPSGAALLDETLAEIYMGIGWSFFMHLDTSNNGHDIRWYADSARINFVESREKNRYSFASTYGLMNAHYYLRIPENMDGSIDEAMINSAITIGRWTLDDAMPSGMNNVFTVKRGSELIYENLSWNDHDVRYLLAASYYSKNDLNEALGEIQSLDFALNGENHYHYLNENDENTWYYEENGEIKSFNSFEAVLGDILEILYDQVN